MTKYLYLKTLKPPPAAATVREIAVVFWALLQQLEKLHPLQVALVLLP